jgi:hypothetical protein
MDGSVEPSFTTHRCATCNLYVVHTVEANHLNCLQLSTESVELALHTVWPHLLWDIEHNASWGPCCAYEDLQAQNSHLQEQVMALWDSLKREKCQVIHLMDKLKKRQKMPHMPPKFTTKLSSVSLVPAASSSCAAALQPMPSLTRVTINLTKEEDRDDVLNLCGDTPDYRMELDSDKELLKGGEIEWLRTLSSIPKGAKHQGKM